MEITSLKEFRKLFDSASGIVFLIDIKTKDLAYVTKRCAEVFSIKDLSTNKVNACKAFVSIDPGFPCDYMKKLKKGQFQTFEIEGPKSNRHYSTTACILTIEGRDYYFCQMTITQKKIKIDDMRFLSDALYAVCEYTTAKGRLQALCDFARNSFQAKYALIYEFVEDCDLLQCKMISFSNKVEDSIKDSILILPNDWKKQIDANGFVYISHLSSSSASHQLLLNASGKIDNIMLTPLRQNGKILGFFAIADFLDQNLKKIDSHFLTLAHFMSPYLTQIKLQNEVQLGYTHDFLTHIGNRQALDNFLENYPKNQPIGILFMDLNGLKKINDKFGHKRGDQYITSLTDVLIQKYGTERSFRMGGDEFLVIIEDPANREVPENEKKLLLQLFKKVKVSAAISALYAPNIKLGFDYYFNRADALMYEDKKKYYESLGK